MKFIRLTSMRINPAIIRHIDIEPNAYHIHIQSTDIYGKFIDGKGELTVTRKTLTIEKKNPDYLLLTKWLKKN